MMMYSTNHLMKEGRMEAIHMGIGENRMKYNLISNKRQCT